MLAVIAAILLFIGDAWHLGQHNWHLDPTAVVIGGLIFLALSGPWHPVVSIRRQQ